MIRILKALGLTAFAAMALSAMFASGASAQGGPGVFTAGLTPSTHTSTPIHAVEEGELTENVFVAFERTLHCETNTFTGTASGTDRALTITPSYKDCYTLKAGTDEPELAETVTLNGCDYTFNQPTEVSGPDTTWEGTVNMVCPEGKSIEVEVYTLGSTGTTEERSTNHGSLLLCRQTIPAQKDLGPITYHNVADSEGKKDDITAVVEIHNLHMIQEGLCGSKETNESEYKSTLTVTSGTPTEPGTDDLWISTGEEGELQ